MITALDDKTALVLIDLQKGIVQTPTADAMAGILANVVKLVTAFRGKGLPVVIVNVNPGLNKNAPTRKDAGSIPKDLPAGWLDIVPEIETRPDDIFITKQTWNAFYQTCLHQQLQDIGITGVVLAGVSTSVGVEGTARAAFELGYNISLAKDAMTDTSADAQAAAIKYIFPRLGEVGDTNDIINVMASR